MELIAGILSAEVWNMTGGNRSRTTPLPGLSRPSLNAKMEKYNLQIDNSGTKKLRLAFPLQPVKNIDAVLPQHWSRGNPIDMLGDAAVDEHRKVVSICEETPGVNGLLVILVPQSMIDPVEMAEAICDQIKDRPIPVLTSWIGGPLTERGRAVFHRAGVPTFDTPERAVRAFTNPWRFARNIELLQQIPSGLPRRLDFDRRKSGSLIRQGLDRKSAMLTEVESKALLTAYGIPTNQTEIAFSADEAVRKAQLMTDFAEIEELDINPLFITGNGFRAVHARARLQRVEVRGPMHLVISPYPDQYETRATTRGLIKIFIRPLRNWAFSAASARR